VSKSDKVKITTGGRTRDQLRTLSTNHRFTKGSVWGKDEDQSDHSIRTGTPGLWLERVTELCLWPDNALRLARARFGHYLWCDSRNAGNISPFDKYGFKIYNQPQIHSDRKRWALFSLISFLALPRRLLGCEGQLTTVPAGSRYFGMDGMGRMAHLGFLILFSVMVKLLA